jgi:hypothetical protein
MSNSLTAASPTLWSKFAAYKLYKSVVFKNLASFAQEAVLSIGRIVDRPYRADLVAENYSKGGMSSTSVQDISYSSNQLTIDEANDVWFKIDDIDKKQNAYDTARLNGEEAGTRLGIRADARFLYEVVNQVNSLDDGDVGGSSGNGIALTVNNVDDVFGLINSKMDEANVPLEERAMVISPFFRRILWNRVASKQSALGDKVAEYGSLGVYDGIKLYVSNNLTCSARWTPADDPSDAATISIQGVTFTFKSTIGTTAGNILRGATTLADTLDNLVMLINAGGVTTDATKAVSLSVANQREVQKWVAVDGTTYIDVFVQGANGLTLTTSEVLDVWSRKYQHNFALRPKYTVDMVMQIRPKTEFQRGIVNGLMGDYAMILQLYGVKTFYAGTLEGVNVKIDEALV